MKTAYYCSTSIENFRHKLQRRFGFKEWHFLKTMFNPAVFFGLYHWVDYLRFLWHRGKRTVFWCGGDILNLRRSKWRRIISLQRARHICENIVEREALAECGIESEIHPCLLDKVEKEIHFTPSKTPHVYLTMHEGRETEYGIEIVYQFARACPDITFHIYGISGLSEKNIVYHGTVSNEQFNEEIKNYHAALRLNEFDGFSEILARSALMGQYPISRIQYPHMTHAYFLKEIAAALNELKEKREPNYTAATFWERLLSESIL